MEFSNKTFETFYKLFKPKVYTFDDSKDRSFWEMMDGVSDYDFENKKVPFKKVLDTLYAESTPLGNTILDLGSGPNPISYLIKDRNKKIITVDFVNPNQKYHKDLHINRNIKSIFNKDSFAFKRTLLEISKYLNIDPRVSKKESIDTIILSDILNYLPYKSLFTELKKYLKPGGVIIIYNQPDRTFKEKEFILDKDGPKSNSEMISFLTKELDLKLIFAREAENSNNYEGEKNMMSCFRKK